MLFIVDLCCKCESVGSCLVVMGMLDTAVFDVIDGGFLEQQEIVQGGWSLEPRPEQAQD